MVVTDLAGTLIRPEPSVAEQYRDGALQFVDAEEVPSTDLIERRFSVAFSKTRLPHGELSYGSTDAEGLWFWKRIVSNVFPQFEDRTLKRLVRRLYRQFEEAKAWTLYPHAEQALQQLREANFQLGLLTNWDTRAGRLIRNLNLSPYFDEIIVSSEVGREKPDPEIFHMMRRRFRSDSETVAMVGNSVEIDLSVPDEMGWTTVLYTPGSEDSWSTETDNWLEVPDLVQNGT